ncbi:MAG: MFS transporter [Lasallia pustulata]|uniref:MFS transporter n=1 Tax=Lasallia pustulata TaxID=136370 RepID=A0A5M8Q290_9LECA|nr:MAG: MFS transporter [Lasallia pustulata]
MAADTRDVLAWRKRDASRPPPLLRYRSAKWFIMMTVCIAVFTDLFLYGIIVPVIPFALSTRAGVPEVDVQHWVSVLLACYGAALLAASPICGWFADHSKSRRAPLLIGLVALAGATVMLLVGSSIGVLVAGRLLQGFSAAVVWTVGLALLVDTVGQKDVGQVMGYVSLSMSLSYLLAPLLGGVVYARAGYFAVYYMAFGLIALDIIMRIALVEKKVAKQWDVPSSAPTPVRESSAVDLPLVVEGPPGAQSAKDSLPAGTSPAFATPSTTPFPSSDNDHPSSAPADPNPKRFSLPPVITLLGSRRLLASLWGCLVQASLLTAFDSVLPLRVQAIFHWNSTGAGLIFLALVLPSLIAPFIGHVSDTSGPRWLAAGGFVLACPFLVLLRLVDHDSVGQKVLLCALLALLGAALTMVMTPLLAEITYVVEAKEKKKPEAFGAGGAYAQAYGLFNVAFAAGSLVGPIWAGFVEQRAGWSTMSWTLGLVSAVSAVPVVVYSGGLITKRHREEKRVGHEEEGKEEDGTTA